MTFVGLCRKTHSGLTHQACLTINATLQRVFFFFPALTFQGLPYLGVWPMSDICPLHLYEIICSFQR